MQLTGLDQLWVADITYIRLQEEFAYLAVVLDAFSRRVVGWAMADHLQASLALAALQMALDGASAGLGQLIHHSDRGVQYACGDYTRAAGGPRHPAEHEPGRLSLRQRQGGELHEDAQAEEVDGRAYRDAEEARARIGTFIEEVYNRQRLHSALSYVAPADFEATLDRARGGDTAAGACGERRLTRTFLSFRVSL